MGKKIIISYTLLLQSTIKYRSLFNGYGPVSIWICAQMSHKMTNFKGKIFEHFQMKLEFKVDIYSIDLRIKRYMKTGDVHTHG